MVNSSQTKRSYIQLKVYKIK